MFLWVLSGFPYYPYFSIGFTGEGAACHSLRPSTGEAGDEGRKPAAEGGQATRLAAHGPVIPFAQYETPKAGVPYNFPFN